MEGLSCVEEVKAAYVDDRNIRMFQVINDYLIRLIRNCFMFHLSLLFVDDNIMEKKYWIIWMN